MSGSETESEYYTPTGDNVVEPSRPPYISEDKVTDYSHTNYGNTKGVIRIFSDQSIFDTTENTIQPITPASVSRKKLKRLAKPTPFRAFSSDDIPAYISFEAEKGDYRTATAPASTNCDDFADGREDDIKMKEGLMSGDISIGSGVYQGNENSSDLSDFTSQFQDEDYDVLTKNDKAMPAESIITRDYIKSLMPKYRDPRLDDPDLITIESVPIHDTFSKFDDYSDPVPEDDCDGDIVGFGGVTENNQVLCTSEDMDLLLKGMLSPLKAAIVVDCLTSGSPNTCKDDAQNQPLRDYHSWTQDDMVENVKEVQPTVRDFDSIPSVSPKRELSPKYHTIRKCKASEDILLSHSDLSSTGSCAKRISSSLEVDQDLANFFLNDELTSSSCGSIVEVSSEEADREVARIMKQGSLDDVICDSSSNWTVSSSGHSGEDAEKEYCHETRLGSGNYRKSGQVENAGPPVEQLQSVGCSDMDNGLDDGLMSGSEDDDCVPPKEFQVENHLSTDSHVNSPARKTTVAETLTQNPEQNLYVPNTIHQEENYMVSRNSSGSDHEKVATLNLNDNFFGGQNSKSLDDYSKNYSKPELSSSTRDTTSLLKQSSCETLIASLPSVPDHLPSGDSSPTTNSNSDSNPEIQKHIDSGIGLNNMDVEEGTGQDQVDFFEMARMRRGYLFRWEMNLLLTQLSREKEEGDRIKREFQRARKECDELKIEVEKLVHKISDVSF